MELLYLSYQDISSLSIPLSDIIRVVENAFRQKGEGLAEMPPKPEFILDRTHLFMRCRLTSRVAMLLA